MNNLEEIDILNKVASSRGGKCLSKKYINNRTKLLWECSVGHQWNASSDSVKRGSWCRACSITRNSQKQKLNYDDIARIAKEKNGECLSKEYINSKTDLLWKCKNGHTWNAPLERIKGTKKTKGSWCPHCAGKFVTINDLKKLAEYKGGKCLSNIYKSTHSKLLWECNKGHQWSSAPSSIKSGVWCPHCANNIKGNLEELKSIATSRGGKCISTKYVNTHSKLRWECKEKHQWENSPVSIKRGQWCPKCAGKQKLTINELQDFAHLKDGKCLSKEYTNNKDKLLWECKNGHQWHATARDVKSNKWCPYCAGKHISINDMQQIAKERGGDCLSTKYISAHAKLIWKCGAGHEFKSPPNSIKNGQWCPHCASGLGERIVRTYFQQIFKKNFPNTKPLWLRSSNGTLLELDGYCDELKLAFEHQGKQHYELNFYTKSQKALDKRIQYDKEKKKLCKENNVILIEIPEIFSDLKLDKLKEYILKQCHVNNVKLPKNISDINIDIKDAYSVKHKILLQKLAAKNNGVSLTDIYLGARVPVEWKCKNNHTWFASPSSIKRGSWCPYCAGMFVNIDDLKKFAISKGGICLSESYINNRTKYKWQCRKGHTWQADYGNVKSGTWCPQCAGNTPSAIEEMIELAKIKNGKCLSSVYESTHKKLHWECKFGHTWYAAPSKIKIGRWCPECSGKQKLTIDIMHQIAHQRNGKCLSPHYTNGKTKLLWECKRGHQWLATPIKIKFGQWCPTCAKKKLPK